MRRTREQGHESYNNGNFLATGLMIAAAAAAERYAEDTTFQDPLEGAIEDDGWVFITREEELHHGRSSVTGMGSAPEDGSCENDPRKSCFSDHQLLQTMPTRMSISPRFYSERDPTPVAGEDCSWQSTTTRLQRSEDRTKQQRRVRWADDPEEREEPSEGPETRRASDEDEWWEKRGDFPRTSDASCQTEDTDNPLYAAVAAELEANAQRKASDLQKQDQYKLQLKQQIEEKKRQKQEEKDKIKREEEKDERRLVEQRQRLQQQYEQEMEAEAANVWMERGRLLPTS